ncbi:hypothetical protein [Sulfurihydrogenibium subterraneum]|uniref:hypothetical protein n=1 Tax=Sulfurihydrogenibium subterraneum TaxID=171121 RepID=UPI0004916663|nr:hypothetical protein [Sulfurihydrogenibium subterraneum]
MKIKDFKKLKIGFLKEDGSLLKEDEVNQYLETTHDIKEKWFLRGIIHILENHFSEAIKRFQLVECDESVLLILACSYKTRDEFVFQEYKHKQFKECGFLKKYSIKPVFIYEKILKPIESIDFHTEEL